MIERHIMRKVCMYALICSTVCMCTYVCERKHLTTHSCNCYTSAFGFVFVFTCGGFVFGLGPPSALSFAVGKAWYEKSTYVRASTQLTTHSYKLLYKEVHTHTCTHACICSCMYTSVCMRVYVYAAVYGACVTCWFLFAGALIRIIEIIAFVVVISFVI